MPKILQTPEQSAIDTKIAAALKELRIERKMTMAVLAAEIGVTFQQIQKYENGKNRVSASTLVLIAKALKVKPGKILDEVVKAVGEVA